MEILTNRFDKKYTDVYMIAGSDRVAEFKKLISQMCVNKHEQFARVVYHLLNMV